MRTPATTTIYDETGKAILTFLRTTDGYFKTHGYELQKFLTGRKIVDGVDEEPNHSNGMGCLAASIIAHFKKKSGTIYIEGNHKKADFHYDIKPKKDGSLSLVGTHERLDLKCTRVEFKLSPNKNTELPKITLLEI